jgi:hypothetical protein
MTLQDLTDKLNEYYKFDIKQRIRQREYVYARKGLFCIGKRNGIYF